MSVENELYKGVRLMDIFIKSLGSFVINEGSYAHIIIKELIEYLDDKRTENTDTGGFPQGES